MRSGLVVAFIISFLFILLVFTGITEGCSYYRSTNLEVNYGDRAEYYVRVENDDQPMGVNIKIEVTEANGKYVISNPQYDLNYGDTGFTHITVHTEGSNEEVITIEFTGSERNPIDSGHHVEYTGRFDTTILPVIDDDTDPGDKNMNILLGVLGISLIGVIFYCGWEFRYSIPGIRAYTRFSRSEILENDNRRAIYDHILQSSEGIRIMDLKRITDCKEGTIVFHLRKLRRHRFIKRVDKLYYPMKSNVEPPMVNRIQQAMENGATSLNKISHETGLSREQVRYQIKKHNLR